MNLPLDLAVRATAATLYDRDAAPATLHVSTDTRTLEPDDTFLALRGERYDGHDFVAEAVRCGAAMLVLERSDARPSGVATMIVEDTKAAYMALAGAARDLFAGRVIAITGSAGKTTSKEFLTQLLSTVHGDRVLAAPGNENNEIGVSKLLLDASNAAHDVIVAEMGARHYGDVAMLVEIARPEIGIITNIGEAHVEIMGSRERLAETKWALFGRGARAVLNAGDRVSQLRARSLEHSPHWFAAVTDESQLKAHAELPLLTALIGDRRLLNRAQHATREIDVAVRVPGLHNRANLAAAIAGALQLETPLERIAPALANVQLPGGRYASLTTDGGIRLIYDAYNANASSMVAALDAFACETASRRIAVLASMAELGDESQALHEQVGEYAAGRVDVLVVQGEFAPALALGARRGGLRSGQIVTVAGNAQAARWLREHARRNDAVLLKGSRKYKLEEIVEELKDSLGA
jgi:UDP-N-acetylmuramoyl-tripeptide--D-alanyl-D-alanine ligase